MSRKQIVMSISLLMCPALFAMDTATGTKKKKKVVAAVVNAEQQKAQQQPAVNPFYDQENPFYKANMQIASSEYDEGTRTYNMIFRDSKSGYIKINSEQVARARTTYGQACWALGDYEQGTQDFDERLRLLEDKFQLKKPLPYAITAEEIKGKTLLVRANEPGTGFGDTFGFTGMLQKFKEAGAKVILVTQNPLKGVMSRSTECADIVYSAKEAEALEAKNELAFDYDMYVMSVWAYASKHGLVPVKTRNDIPKFEAYIHPQEKLLTKWQAHLQGSRPLVICWDASPNPVPGGRLLKRGIELKVLALLANAKNVKLYSVQGDGKKPVTQEEFDKLATDKEKERDLLGIVTPEQKQQITLFDDSFDKDAGAFEDTAAVMVAAHQLGGYVVSVDTSVPNFAGGLGVRTCLLLARHCDTRWDNGKPGAKARPNRKYKSVVDFKQDKDGDWQPVIQNVIEYIDSNQVENTKAE